MVTYNNIIIIMELVFALGFVFIWPWLLLSIVKKLDNDKEQLLLIFGIGLTAIIFGSVSMKYIGTQPSLIHVGLFLLSICTTSSSAVTFSYLLLKKYTEEKKKFFIIIGSLLQFPFLFDLIINPDTWDGGPQLLFSDRLPLLGLLFDSITEMFGKTGFSGSEIVFTFGLFIGLFLELLIFVLLVFFIIHFIFQFVAKINE